VGAIGDVMFSSRCPHFSVSLLPLSDIEWKCPKDKSPGLQTAIKMVGEGPYLISDLDRRGQRRSFVERYDPSLKTMIPVRPYARWVRWRIEGGVRAGPLGIISSPSGEWALPLLPTCYSICLSFCPPTHSFIYWPLICCLFLSTGERQTIAKVKGGLSTCQDLSKCFPSISCTVHSHLEVLLLSLSDRRGN
jgi:hypothetical protein